MARGCTERCVVRVACDTWFGVTVAFQAVAMRSQSGSIPSFQPLTHLMHKDIRLLWYALPAPSIAPARPTRHQDGQTRDTAAHLACMRVRPSLMEVPRHLAQAGQKAALCESHTPDQVLAIRFAAKCSTILQLAPVRVHDQHRLCAFRKQRLLKPCVLSLSLLHPRPPPGRHDPHPAHARTPPPLVPASLRHNPSLAITRALA